MLHSRRRFHANAPGTTPRFPIPPSAAELSDRGSDGIPLELAQKDRQSSACQSLSAWPRDQQEIWADSAFEPLLDVPAGRFDLDFEWQRSCSLNVQVSFNSNHEGHEVTPRKSLLQTSFVCVCALCGSGIFYKQAQWPPSSATNFS